VRERVRAVGKNPEWTKIQLNESHREGASSIMTLVSRTKEVGVGGPRGWSSGAASDNSHLEKKTKEHGRR